MGDEGLCSLDVAAANRRGMSIVRLDLRNSGDTAGPRDRVVGYGSWALFEPADQQLYCTIPDLTPRSSVRG